MQKIKLTILSFFMLLGVAALVPNASVGAVVNPAQEIQSGADSAGASGEKSLGERVQDIVNLMLFILGAIAVVMIVIGGIKYATSNGDSSAVTSAKNTILYAVVGLVVAILAYAIVNFVLNAFK